MTPRTVVIFDWDDTILPTSYLNSLGYTLKTQNIDFNVYLNLQLIQEQVLKVFKQAFDKTNHVYIVTNADKDWVNMTMDKYLPGLGVYFDKITILSAKELYSESFPNNPNLWKHFTFQRFGVYDKVISIGDSLYERQAIINLNSVKQRRSIKFIDRPTAIQLRFQLNKIETMFDHIYWHERDLIDSMITITPKA